MGGDRHQAGAIVVGLDLDAGGQGAVAIDLLDLGLDACNHLIGLQGPVHHHDGGDHVVLVVASGFAQPWREADLDLGDILDLHRYAIVLRQDDILDILDVLDQPDPANIDRLLAEVDRAPAHVDIGVAERRDHLWQRDVVGLQLVQVGVDVVFLGRAAPAHHLHHARHGLQPPLQHPVLQRAQIGQAEVRRSLELVAVDLPHQAGGLDLRLHIVWQADVLLQAERRLRVGKVVVDAVPEGHAHEGKAVERSRADTLDAWRGRQANFHGHRVVALHLLG